MTDRLKHVVPETEQIRLAKVLRRLAETQANLPLTMTKEEADDMRRASFLLMKCSCQ